MRFALSILMFALLARADEYQFQGQFDYSPIEPNVVEQGAQYQVQITRLVAMTAGARMALSGFQVDRMEYAGGVRISPFRWISANLRVNQQAILSIGSGATDLLGTIRLEAYPFSFVGAFVEFGWFERWLEITATPLVPAFSPVSAHDHDFAAQFGFHLLPVQSFRITASAGTIDDILVYNFNNPFMEIRTSLFTRDLEIFAFSRYRLLLGFGRLDEFDIGLGVKFSRN